jgi:hypothetical protein
MVRAGSARHRNALVPSGHERSRSASQNHRSHALHRYDLGRQRKLSLGSNPTSPQLKLRNAPIGRGGAAKGVGTRRRRDHSRRGASSIGVFSQRGHDRPATVQDAPALGRLNVCVWQVAYGLPVRAAARGQMPDEHLDGLRPEERAAGWERGLSRDRDQDPVLVAEEAGRVVGFTVVGPAQDPEGAGELYAINVDPDHWGRASAEPCWPPPRPNLPGWATPRRCCGCCPTTPARAGSTRSRAGSQTASSAPARCLASRFPRCATGGDCRPTQQGLTDIAASLRPACLSDR